MIDIRSTNSARIASPEIRVLLLLERTGQFVLREAT
jgi:hypothetical protein